MEVALPSTGFDKYNCAKCKNIFTHRRALMMHKSRIHFRGDQEEDGVKKEGANVQVKRKIVHECPKCGETYKKLPTLNLHMRDDHSDAKEHKGDEEQKVKEQLQKANVQINEIEMDNVGQENVCDDELKNARNKLEQKADQHQSPDSAVAVVELLVNDKVEDEIQKLKQEVSKEYYEDDDEDELISDVASKSVSQCEVEEDDADCEKPLNITSTCSICHKEYRSLYHHMRFTHDKIKNYECSHCKKKFLGQNVMNKHVQSVHLEKKTNCPDCKRDFSINYLRTHIKEFHGCGAVKKPCSQCGKKFGISNLVRHIRQVHNNESITCPDCGKAIAYSNLKKHMKAVHNQLTQLCNLCNKKIPYSSFSYHKIKVHSVAMAVDYVTTKDPKQKLKKWNLEEFDQTMKELNTLQGLNEEGNEEDFEEFEVVHPNIEGTKEDSRKYRLDKQASLAWTWSEPFTIT